MDAPVIATFRFALDLAVKSTFLFLATGAVLLLLRRRSAAARHLAATAGLASALLFPLLAPALPRLDVPLFPSFTGEMRRAPARRIETLDPARETASRAWTKAADVASPTSGDRDRSIAAVKRPQARAAAISSRAAKTPRTRTYVAFVLPVPVMTAILGLWAGGALVLAGRLALGIARVRRCRRRAKPVLAASWTGLARTLGDSIGVARAVPLFVSDELPVAVTSGVRHPALLLPEDALDWDFGRRRVVLLHELAHVARRDWATLVLCEIAVALFWFHPLVWVLARRFRRDVERAADDRVLSAGTKPSVYAGHLLGIIRSLNPEPRRALTVMGVARPSHFEERMRAILDPATRRRGPTVPQMGFAGAALIAVAGGAAMVQPWTPLCPGMLAAEFAVASNRSDETAHEAKKSRPNAARPAIRMDNAAPSGSSRPAVRADGVMHDEIQRRIRHGIERGISEGIERGISEGIEQGVGVAGVVAGGIVGGVSGGLDGALSERGFVKTSHRSTDEASDAYHRARELHQRGRYEEAADAFRAAYEAGYRRDVSAYNAACALARAGKRDEAWEWLTKASAEGFRASSRIQHDEDLASLRSDPRLAERRAKLASAEAESRRGSEEAHAAVRRFERLANDAPGDGSQWYAAGKELLSVGRYDLAERAFKLSARRGFRVPASLYNTACALALAGERNGALDYLQQAIESGFGGADAIRKDDDLAALRSEPRYGELLDEAAALELHPDGDSLWKSAETFLESGKSRERERWAAAVRRYQEFANAHPNLGRAWFNLGFATLAAGDPAAGEHEFQKALALDYRRATSMYNLACANARLGRKDEAFHWLFRALDEGFDAKRMLRRDDDLDALRGDARFDQALQIAETGRRKK